MITRIEVENFKCLKDVKIDTKDFQLLIGPNGSGKSTFMDVILLLQDLTRYGLIDSIFKNSEDDRVIGRARSVSELFSNTTPNEISFTFFIQVPGQTKNTYNHCKYEIIISIQDINNNTLSIKHEKLLLDVRRIKKQSNTESQILFSRDKSSMVFFPERNSDKIDITDINRTVISDYIAYLMPFLQSKNKIEFKDFDILMHYLTWLNGYFISGIRKIELKDQLLKNPVPIGSDKRFLSNTPNLTAIIEKMTNENKQRWVDHIQLIYPEIKNILATNDRLSAIKYFYYATNDERKIMSWQMSTGTVRLLALTSLAYFDTNYCYLIEEPENGLHPTAIQDIVDSLKSIHKGQVFIASHSPIILSCVELNDILCFSRENIYTKIVPGSKKTFLKNWKSEITIGDLFVKGLLDN